MAFAFYALVWALASWVYFDSIERGRRYPVAWGLAVLLLGWSLIPEIVYMATRNQLPRREVAGRAGTRQYLVTTVFVTMALAVAGGATALATAFTWAVGHQFDSNTLRDTLASGAAAFIIGLGLWYPHWRWLERRMEGPLPDDEFRAHFRLRRVEVLTVVYLYGAIAALTALWFLGGAISAMLQASYAAATAWLPVLGPALCTAAATAYHAWYHRRAESSALAARFAAIPPPRLIPAPAKQPWAAPPPPAHSVMAPPGPGQAAMSGPGPVAQAGPGPVAQAGPGRVAQPGPGPVAQAGPGRHAPPAWQPPSPSTPPAGAVPVPPPPPSSAPLAGAAPAPPLPGERMTTPPPPAPGTAGAVRFCGHCGTEVEPGDRYCRACGAALEAHAAAVDGPAKVYRRSVPSS